MRGGGDCQPNTEMIKMYYNFIYEIEGGISSQHTFIQGDWSVSDFLQLVSKVTEELETSRLFLHSDLQTLHTETIT